MYARANYSSYYNNIIWIIRAIVKLYVYIYSVPIPVLISRDYVVACIVCLNFESNILFLSWDKNLYF